MNQNKTAPVAAEPTVASLVASIEASIAQLRAIAEEPVSIKLSDFIDIELRPIAGGDERVLVGRVGWGSTTVNYTSEGLILDVYAHAEIDTLHTAYFYPDDLASCDDTAPTPHSAQQMERYALVAKRVVDDPNPVLAAAWIRLCEAENQLAFLMCAKGFESMVFFEETGFFLEQREGEVQLMLTSKLESGWSEPQSRFDVCMEVLSYDANELDESTKFIRQVIEAYPQLEHQSAREVIPEYFQS